MSEEPESNSILSVIEIHRLIELYGLPTYGYFKQWMQSTRRGRNIEHYRTGWSDCTEAEYNENRQKSAKTDSARFMGDFKGSFYRYERRLVKEGWPQILARELKTMEEKETYYHNR